MSGATSPQTVSDPEPRQRPTEEGPLLELARVTKRFGGLQAVDDLSFVVHPGEVLGVIGPNGAGKSTVVGLIAGALTPTSGVVRYRGRDINTMPANRRSRLGIARTFQITQPFAGLDIRENVMVGALFGRHRLHRSAALRLAEEVLDTVGLAHKASLKGDELTTADRKRLELARALAAGPELLLLDEVMAGLTHNEVMDAVALIREINRGGVTVVVIEHIMRAITGVSDRVVVMHYGQKIAEDVPSRVLSDPAVIEAYLGSRYARRRQTEDTPLDVANPPGSASEVGQLDESSD